MNINEILKSNPGISLIAGNLKAGGYAIQKVDFSDSWSDEKKSEFMESIKASLAADANLYDANSLKTFASENDDVKLYELKNVEIFRTGTWNGQKFTDQDLQDIVDAFPKQGYQVPIKLGHRESSGDKAYGWVKSLRKIGDKLVADFADLPGKIYESIKSRSYDAVSSEIFSNLKRGKLLFRKALKAVALLGSEIPAVAGLKPLRDSFSLPDGSSFDHEYAFQLSNEDINMDATQLKAQLDAALAELAELKKSSADPAKVTELTNQVTTLNATVAEFKEKDRQNGINAIVAKCRVPAYREHLSAIMNIATGGPITTEFSIGTEKMRIEKVTEKLIDKINADAELLFKNQSRSPVTEMQPGGKDTVSVSSEVATKVEAFIAANKGVDYATAMQAVLAADPELAARYNAAD